MKSIKLLALLVMIVGKTAFASGQLEGTYSFQLYFGDSKPFTDELTLVRDQNGNYSGSIHVPNDFDTDLENIKIETDTSKTEVAFYIELPPKYYDAFGRRLFYKIIFLHTLPYEKFNGNFVGFVTHHKWTIAPNYVGSIVGFRKKN